MKTITITSADIANEILSSYSLYKRGFKSETEHSAAIFALHMLVGDEMWDEACKIAEEKREDK